MLLNYEVYLNLFITAKWGLDFSYLADIMDVWPLYVLPQKFMQHIFVCR